MPKKTNPGIEIRNRTRAKKRAKMHTVKPYQLDMCRFVECSYATYEYYNHSNQYAGREDGQGLQIRNRVYLLDGKYKFVNNKSFHLKKAYDAIPEWATQELIDKYNKFMEDKAKS